MELLNIETDIIKCNGIYDKTIHFIQNWQLKDKALWQKFVNQYRTHPDSKDSGWRGEYWGKMMRGACFTYSYTKDEELYNILEMSVKELLSTQDKFGRISTYLVDDELKGWDMWSRKYVLVGMECFYDICKDELLKQQIVTALKKHLDYIISKVGSQENKINIVDTSNIWGSVNSCSILGSVIRLFELTNENKYFDFASYIISVGGCKDGNLIQLALENKLLPHEYPTRKAYETMSFFEGVLAYYQITKEQKYLDAVINFFDLVINNEISIIGCSGCEHELFDNTINSQIKENNSLMQETCVTVTFMCVITKLLLLTKNVKYAVALEKSKYNAMLGSVNTEKQNGWDYWGDKSMVDAFPFDSYSPLFNDKRGRGVGGFKIFEEGGAYGCCACIGSAGIALIPLTTIFKDNNGFIINELVSLDLKMATSSGNLVSFKSISKYPELGKYKLTISLENSEEFDISIRIPNWCKNAKILVNDCCIDTNVGFNKIHRQWKDNDTISVEFHIAVETFVKDNKISFNYGAIALCYDKQKNKTSEVLDNIFLKDLSNVKFELLEKLFSEQVRLNILLDNGQKILLTDYASCGKKWNEPNSEISVWFNLK